LRPRIERVPANAYLMVERWIVFDESLTAEDAARAVAAIRRAAAPPPLVDDDGDPLVDDESPLVDDEGRPLPIGPVGQTTFLLAEAPTADHEPLARDFVDALRPAEPYSGLRGGHVNEARVSIWEWFGLERPPQGTDGTSNAAANEPAAGEPSANRSTAGEPPAAGEQEWLILLAHPESGGRVKLEEMLHGALRFVEAFWHAARHQRAKYNASCGAAMERLAARRTLLSRRSYAPLSKDATWFQKEFEALLHNLEAYCDLAGGYLGAALGGANHVGRALLVRRILEARLAMEEVRVDVEKLELQMEADMARSSATHSLGLGFISGAALWSVAFGIWTSFIGNHPEDYWLDGWVAPAVSGVRSILVPCLLLFLLLTGAAALVGGLGAWFRRSK
jgi:hypothetical protein